VKELKTDILILGSGGAGLFAALHAHQANSSLSITVAVKGLLGKCGCTRMVQGGYNVALAAGDSVERHFMDTIEGGKWLPDQDLAWTLVSVAVERIHELENELGCFFDRNPDGTVRGDLVIGSRPGYGEPPPRAYLLYGSNAGLGQVQIIEHGSGAFAAADFNTKVGADGRYADLARVNQNETVNDSFNLEVFAGSAAGLPTAKSQSIPLTALDLPDPPDTERLLQLNAAGSR